MHWIPNLAVATPLDGPINRMPLCTVFLSSPVWGTTAKSKVCQGQKKHFSIHIKDTLKKFAYHPKFLLQPRHLACNMQAWVGHLSLHLYWWYVFIVHSHPVLPATSVAESVHQTLCFAAMSKATLNSLPLVQRLCRNQRTTPRNCTVSNLCVSNSDVINVESIYSKCKVHIFLVFAILL